MKNQIISFLAGATLLTGALLAGAQAVVIGGYPVFTGSFQSAGPVPSFASGATFGGTITNTAALQRVANPLTLNVYYTNTANAGFLKATTLNIGTNIVQLVNVTTTDATTIQGLGVSITGTNYNTTTIRTGPNEVVILTNSAATTTLVSSEWRN